MDRRIAVLGGGCFWCLEAVFVELGGVLAVESGYSGGHVFDPSYEQVCDGDTGHAEVVRVEFDADRLSFRELLEAFFAIHDPTTRDRQGNDIGPQYRSVVFAVDDDQARIAREVIQALDRDGVFGSPIVTEVEPLGQYFRAEAYHQRYFENHPGQGYCVMVVAPKLAKFRRRFAGRLEH